MLKDASGKPLNGLNPLKLNGNPSVLGNSIDPEGIVIEKNGNVLISDEYGPSIREFSPSGKLLRVFESPLNVVPRLANGTVDYMGDRSALASGRQDNRGFEGLARWPDGSRVFAMLQDPLDEEGSDNDGKPDGRYGKYLRIVEFFTATGKSNRQFFYELESYKKINERLEKPDNFTGSSQGRNSELLSFSCS